jgi:hypothetical protein
MAPATEACPNIAKISSFMQREIYGQDVIPDFIRIVGCGGPDPSDAGAVDGAIQSSLYFERESYAGPDALQIP